jgi:hypothetical protein
LSEKYCEISVTKLSTIAVLLHSLLCIKSTRFSAGGMTILVDNGERFGKGMALERLWGAR